ncbi:MAG: PIN domain-containing protein [Blastocatellia bacterium]|nr:PIN domain-containing protein [Blastocatellia bacterium]
MILYVTDTHSLFWYLIASPHLSAKAKDAFDQGKAGLALIYVPAIVLAELYYLNEKLGGALSFADEYTRLSSSGQFVFLPLVPEEILEFDADEAVTEMHDRIVVGAARRLGATLISKDQQITAAGIVPLVW